MDPARTRDEADLVSKASHSMLAESTQAKNLQFSITRSHQMPLHEVPNPPLPIGLNPRQTATQHKNCSRLPCPEDPQALWAPAYHPTRPCFLQFLCSLRTYGRGHGHMIVDRHLQIVFADRQAKQILEASLSSLNGRLLDLIVAQDRQTFVGECLDALLEGKWVEYLIYSRACLRKYELSPQLEAPTAQDYFYRYLKPVSSYIVPIQLIFGEGFEQPADSYFDAELAGKVDKLFYFKTSSSLYLPKLEKYDFSQDETLQKYHAHTQSKKARLKKQELRVSNSAVEKYLNAQKRTAGLQKQLGKKRQLLKIEEQAIKREQAHIKYQEEAEQSPTPQQKRGSRKKRPPRLRERKRICKKQPTSSLNRPMTRSRTQQNMLEQRARQLILRQDHQAGCEQWAGHRFPETHAPLKTRAAKRTVEETVRHDDEYISQFLL